MLPSERAGVPVPLTETVGPRFWAGLVSITRDLAERGFFAFRAPHTCDDQPHPICGTDTGQIGLALYGNTGIAFPLDSRVVPESLSILDAAEYLDQFVGKPGRTVWHDFFSHTHFLDYDREAGAADYRAAVNALLSRCGHPFEFNQGRIERRGPGPLSGLIAATTFNTGDAALDTMLEDSVHKYHDPDPKIRREALEKLWDSWQRLRTLEYPPDTKKSAAILIAKAEPDPPFAKVLDEDALALNDVGNSFMIRHFEVTKHPIASDDSVDYLFYRLFTLIHRLAKGTGRLR
jgi:hypothetical protein